MKKNWIYLLFVVSILLGACSVQKRVYRKGYHVVWNHKRIPLEKKYVQEPLPEIKPEVAEASAENDPAVLSLPQKPLLLLKDTCGDKLLLHNAEELHVKILEISEQTITYKRCDNMNGPQYTIQKNKVALITYANGMKETVIVEPEPVVELQQPPTNFEPYYPDNRKTNQSGLYSFLLHVLVVFFTLALLIALAFSSFFDLTPFVVGIALIAILSMALAIQALFQFKKDPETFKGKIMPMLTVTGYLTILLGIIYGLIIEGAFSALIIPLIVFFVLAGLFVQTLLPKDE